MKPTELETTFLDVVLQSKINELIQNGYEFKFSEIYNEDDVKEIRNKILINYHETEDQIRKKLIIFTKNYKMQYL